jgi:pimeloyl-ACP methyl ester carboxylesterase
MEHPTFYRTIQIDGLSIFYREAGPKDAPTLLLLHGFPSSSRMYEPLFARLSDRYHLIAPDYPGFGHSDWPDPKKFAYTFDHCTEIMNHFTEALGLSRYTLYMQDYGGPVGFRMVLAHPDRIEALIVQNAVAHNEGLGAIWKPRRAFWADRAANENALRTNFLSLETTRGRHIGSDPNVDRYDPDLWTDEFAFLSKRGRRTFKAICSTTIKPTWKTTRNGKHGCAQRSRGFSSYGEYTTPRSKLRNRGPMVATFQTPKSTSSMRAISRSIPRQMRLRRCYISS